MGKIIKVVKNNANDENTEAMTGNEKKECETMKGTVEKSDLVFIGIAFVVGLVLMGVINPATKTSYANIPLSNKVIFPVEDISGATSIDFGIYCDQKIRTVRPDVSSYTCYAKSLYNVQTGANLATGLRFSINCECLI